MMTTQEIKEIILKELPTIIEEDPEIRRLLAQLSRRRFADRDQTDDRFDRILDELRRNRELDAQKWEEQRQKWAEQSMHWAEQDRKWEENQKAIWATQADIKENQKAIRDVQADHNRKWEENQKAIWAMQADIEENQKAIKDVQAEHKQKWDVNQVVINDMLAEIRTMVRKYDSTIGALGARWGLHSEQSFRNALKGILEKLAAVEVLNVIEYDDAGEVFGRPEQIELDIIIKNGKLTIVEIKSSMSKPDMYMFERKVRFYEGRHNRKANEMIVISPMVVPNAVPAAEKLGIKIYSYAEDVKL